MIDPLLNTAKENMKKAFDVTSGDLSSIRSGRATPALVENIVINAYEGTQKLKLMEMATISVSDPKTILVSPYDSSQTASIEKGIYEAHIGLTPIVDSENIRITIPPLSAERRQEYIKLAKAKIESGKVMVRQIRHEALKSIKQLEDNKDISEDEAKVGEKKTQELTDSVTRDLEDLLKRKEQELTQL